jgi:uncharacterized protein YlaI
VLKDKGGVVLEVRCSLCGRKEIISEVHKDFEKIVKNSRTIYFCDLCLSKVQYEANEYNKPKKPIG